MATNFLWYAGTSNNGLVVPAFNLFTTEMNSLASGSGIVSSVGGSSGVFNNANWGQAMWCELFFFAGAPAITTVSPAALAGWWITSPDGGTTYEPTTTTPARPPD